MNDRFGVARRWSRGLGLHLRRFEGLLFMRKRDVARNFDVAMLDGFAEVVGVGCGIIRWRRRRCRLASQ